MLKQPMVTGDTFKIKHRMNLVPNLINLSFGFICPVDLRESPRRAEIAMGFILKNRDPIAILSIRGFDAVHRADKPKTQVNKVGY